MLAARSQAVSRRVSRARARLRADSRSDGERVSRPDGGRSRIRRHARVGRDDAGARGARSRRIARASVTPMPTRRRRRSSGTTLHDVVVGRERVRARRDLGRDGGARFAISAATGITSMAISAVDIALWDLRGKLLDRPVAALLGMARERVPVYGSGGFTSYDTAQLCRQLDGWVASGIPRVKMKIGRDPAADVRRIAAARAAIGDEAELFVDANGAYAVKQALELARNSPPRASRWYEEPVYHQDFQGLAARARCGPRVDGGHGRRIRLRAVPFRADARSAAPSTCCKPMRPDAAGLPDCSRSTGSVKATIDPALDALRAVRSPARRGGVEDRCGTWSISSTTCASSGCSSTVPREPVDGSLAPDLTRPGDRPGVSRARRRARSRSDDAARPDRRARSRRRLCGSRDRSRTRAPWRRRPLTITLVNRENYLLFTPMLPEVASGSLDMRAIAHPLRRSLRRTQLRPGRSDATSTSARATVTVEHPVLGRSSTLRFDHLVFALGARDDHARHPRRRRALVPAQDAARRRTPAHAGRQRLRSGGGVEHDRVERDRLLRFVIVGGGFTGDRGGRRARRLLRRLHRSYPALHDVDARNRRRARASTGCSTSCRPRSASAPPHRCVRRDVAHRARRKSRFGRCSGLSLQERQALRERDGRMDRRRRTGAAGQEARPANLRARSARRQTETSPYRASPGVWGAGDCARIPKAERRRVRAARAKRGSRGAAPRPQHRRRRWPGKPTQAVCVPALGTMASLGNRDAVAQLPGNRMIAGLPAWLMWRAYYLGRLPGLSQQTARRGRLDRSAGCSLKTSRACRGRRSTRPKRTIMQLKDKVAIVTGGDTGIGKAISLAFAREGACVVIDYHGDAAPANALVERDREARFASDRVGRRRRRTRSRWKR